MRVFRKVTHRFFHGGRIQAGIGLLPRSAEGALKRRGRPCSFRHGEAPNDVRNADCQVEAFVMPQVAVLLAGFAATSEAVHDEIVTQSHDLTPLFVRGVTRVHGGRRGAGAEKPIVRRLRASPPCGLKLCRYHRSWFTPQRGSRRLPKEVETPGGSTFNSHEEFSIREKH